jgi:signal transduction histidine kinase
MKHGLRGRLLAAVILAVATALALIVLAFNLILDARLNADANDLLRSRATVTLDSLQVVDGRLGVQEAPDAGVVDRPIWIFSGSRLLEAPQAGAALDRVARRLATGSGRRVDFGDSTRLLSLPITSHGRRVGTVVAGISLSPYAQSERIALIASLSLAAVVLLAVALASRWLLRAGLRPMVRMSVKAAEWSEHDLDRRFDLGPPRDEFTRLAAALDQMLDRLAASVQREQRFSAELSHELRTPLARIRARAQLAMAGDNDQRETRAALVAAVSETDNLTRALDALVAASRAELGKTLGFSSDARVAAEAVATDCSPSGDSRGVEIHVEAPEGLRVGVDSDLIERILHPVVENACRHANSRVRIAVVHERQAVIYLVEDDGPGVASNERERIFEPGVSGQDAKTEGAGLGLALARRLARAGGGEVEARASTDGGRFAIRLPQA